MSKNYLIRSFILSLVLVCVSFVKIYADIAPGPVPSGPSFTVFGLIAAVVVVAVLFLMKFFKK